MRSSLFYITDRALYFASPQILGPFIPAVPLCPERLQKIMRNFKLVNYFSTVSRPKKDTVQRRCTFSMCQSAFLLVSIDTKNGQQLASEKPENYLKISITTFGNYVTQGLFARFGDHSRKALVICSSLLWPCRRTG